MQLHISNGSSSAESLKQAFNLSEANLLPVNDLLSFGPLQQFTDLQSWVEIRENYWNGIWRLCALEPIPSSKMRRDFYYYCDELHKAEKIHIWLGSSLGDQIMLCFVVMFCQYRKIDLESIFIHQLPGFYKDQKLQNPALLKPEVLAEFTKAFQLTAIQILVLEKAWSALVCDSFEKYENLIKEDCPELPFLIPAFRAFQYRHPEQKTGLSIWQKYILHSVSRYPGNASSIVGHVLGKARDGLDLIGDLSVFAEIKKMGSTGSTALLKLNTCDAGMRETTVELTSFGEDVLAGKANCIDIIGIDDWIAGVHLKSLKAM